MISETKSGVHSNSRNASYLNIIPTLSLDMKKNEKSLFTLKDFESVFSSVNPKNKVKKNKSFLSGSSDANSNEKNEDIVVIEE